MLQKTVVRDNANLVDKSKLVKVAATSRSTAVAGAIAGIMRNQHSAEVQAIGAGAINQAVKAMAIARLYLKDDGIDFVCTPEFINIDIEGSERTALHFALDSCTPRDFL
jgi:stage V sporulation protein S